MGYIFIAHMAYQVATPYDYLALVVTGKPEVDWAEVETVEINEQGTLAAAFATAGYWIGIGIIAKYALAGLSFASLSENPTPLYASCGKLAIGLIAMIIISRLFADKILLPKAKMSDEISIDKNRAAGLVAGASYVGVSLILVAVAGIL